MVVLPILNFLLEATGMVVAIWLGTLLMHKIGIKPVALMFLLPAIAVFWNLRNRLQAAKAGMSPVQEKLMREWPESSNGCNESDLSATVRIGREDVLAKRGALWGSMVGLGIGISLFLKDSNFV